MIFPYGNNRAKSVKIQANLTEREQNGEER